MELVKWMQEVTTKLPRFNPPYNPPIYPFYIKPIFGGEPHTLVYVKRKRVEGHPDYSPAELLPTAPLHNLRIDGKLIPVCIDGLSIKFFVAENVSSTINGVTKPHKPDPVDNAWVLKRYGLPDAFYRLVQRVGNPWSLITLIVACENIVRDANMVKTPGYITGVTLGLIRPIDKADLTKLDPEFPHEVSVSLETVVKYLNDVGRPCKLMNG